MKKILLIIAIAFLIFQMGVLATTIDIGSPAIGRGSYFGQYTTIVKDNPALASGKITSIEIWADVDLINCKVATFFVVSGNNLSTRDSQVIGTVQDDSKRTFVVDLDVEVGDYIGIYYTAGTIERDTSGQSGIWHYYGDLIPCTNQAFGTTYSDDTISLYGTGETVGWPHKWNTMTIGKWNTKEFTKWNGLE